MITGKTIEEGNAVLIPYGRLDSLTSGEFEQEVSSVLCEDIKSLTVDMKSVDFISSKGLRVLVGAYKKLNGKDMYIKNANPSVIEIFRLSGLLKVFNIVSNE